MEWNDSGFLNELTLSRRSFVKLAAVAGGALASGMNLSSVAAEEASSPDKVEGERGVKIIRSACQMCHSACAIMVKVVDGVAVKIDGNPYSPNAAEPHLSYDTPTSEADKIRGTICIKGAAGLQDLYNPYRVKQPLKRAGPRGSGKWKAVSWDKAVEEIVEGATLPGAKEGEADYTFKGLRALRDLDNDVDPSAPELGKKVNQVVHMVGRSEHGRKEFTDRFWGDAYGTVNKRIDHTSICETSHHVGFELMNSKGKGHFKPDFVNSKYVILFGTSPFEANFPMQTLMRKVNIFRMNGGKLVIVDPKLSNTAAKADQWIPIKPGADAAFGLGMMRWIIENKKYDEDYLKGTKARNGHTTWSDATHLVQLDTMQYLRGKMGSDFDDIGSADEGYDEAKVAVYSNGKAVTHDETDTADLEVDTTVNGIAVKSVFTLLKERVMEKSIADYASICGVSASTIENVSKEFASHGTKACADFYRGPVQHTNGTYNARTLALVNVLVGNFGWKGGMNTGGGHWHELGNKEGQPYNLKKLHPGKASKSGIVLTRFKKKYEDSTEYKNNGYPAKRPWFPFATHGNFQEIFPSIADQYPYAVKAVIGHQANPTYAVPAGSNYIDSVFRNSNKMPLYVTFTTVMGDTDSLADYILPDRAYLERYATPHTAPAINTKQSQIRQPVVDPVYPNAKLEEDAVIMIAKKLGLEGYGKDGFGPGMDLNEAKDWYLKMFTNIGVESGLYKGKSNSEALAGVLAKGGAFEDYSKSVSGDNVGHAFKGEIQIFSEKMAKSKDSITGKKYDGLPLYEPIRDSAGKDVKPTGGYTLKLNTTKMVQHKQSCTIQYDWLRDILPENHVQINSADAAKLGIKNGDKVKVTSASNTKGVVGSALVNEEIIPGVVNIPHHFGHWQYGAKSYSVDGKSESGNSEFGAGISANPLMDVDGSLKAKGRAPVSLQDPIGGSCSYYDTFVKVEKV